MTSYNPTTGQIEDGPDTTPRVPMLGPEGVERSVPQSQIRLFLDSGYQLDTPEARQEVALQKQYGEGLGNELAAAGLGAARSLSFGLSDLALSRTGLVEAQTLQQLKQRNPDATLTGELGALAFPLFGGALGAIKGASTAAQVARGTGAVLEGLGGGVTGLGKLGAGVGKAAAKLTGSQLLGSAAQAAAEGLAFQIGSNLSESVLGEHEITAERLLAHGGMALGVGAGLGFGVPLAVKGIGAVAAKAKQALDGVGAALKERILPAASDAAAGAYSKAYAAATGGGRDVADEVFGVLSGGFKAAPAKERAALVKAIAPEQFDDTLRAFTDQLDDAHRSVQGVVKQAFGTSKPKEIAKLLEDVDMRPALADVGNLINEVEAVSKKMAAEPLLYDQTYRRELEIITSELRKRAGSEAGGLKVGFSSTRDVWETIDKIKSVTFGDLSKKTATMGRATENSVFEVQSLYRSFKNHLENPALYGDAAARQAALNEAFSTFQSLVEKRNRFTGKPGAFHDHFIGSNGEIDPKKTLRFLRKIGSARDMDELQALTDYQAAARTLVEQAETTTINAGIDAATIDRKGFESILSKLVDTQKKAAEDLTFVSKVRSQDAFGMALMNFQKSVGETLFKEGVFSATLKLASRAANPFGVAKTLSTAESFVLNTSGRVRDTVDRLVGRMGGAGGKAVKALRPYAEPASVKVLLKSFVGDDGDDAPKGRQDGYRKTLKRLSDAQADPGGFAERQSAGLVHLQKAAPNTARAVVNTQLRAAQFLHDKAPKNPHAGKTINPFLENWQPSDLELAKFERYAAAVQDPLGVLDELEHGTVSPEAAEALRVVYPNLYEDIQRQLIERVSTIEAVVPYHDKLMLSMLFGVQLDPSLDTGFVNALQTGYNEAAQQAAQESTRSAYRPTSAAAKLGALEETPAQRIQRR